MENLQLSQFSNYLAPRSREFHKGNAGHVLVVGGDLGFSGAVCLAAQAALRVGAGLVSIATRVEHALVLNTSRPEIMCHGVKSEVELKNLLEKSDIVIIGPGLGQSTWSHEMLSAVLKCEKNLVVDADALNMLAEKPYKKDNWILTPHPGEAGRLLKMMSETIQKDRLSAAEKLRNQFGGVSVLKGAGTLVMGPSEMLSICKAGNPGMATAGMGDVLSGAIGGWVAQGVPLEDAAKLGVLLHALAGDRAAKQGERGMIASDLFPYLRELSNWK